MKHQQKTSKMQAHLDDLKVASISDFYDTCDQRVKQAGAGLCQAQGKMFLDYNSIGEPPPPRHVQG